MRFWFWSHLGGGGEGGEEYILLGSGIFWLYFACVLLGMNPGPCAY